MAHSLQQIVEQYIIAYNNFDLDGMLKKLHPAIVFKNITQGEVDLVTNGLTEFKSQAEKATTLFSERNQVITGFKFRHQQVEVAIDYQAVLAIDLPNGLKKGEGITLKGKSIFNFENDLIVLIEDYS